MTETDKAAWSDARNLLRQAYIWYDTGGEPPGTAVEIVASVFAELAALRAERDALRTKLQTACEALERAAEKYDEFHKWVCEQISTAAYNAEELEQGLVGWQPFADTMFNGTMASWESAIIALIPKGPAND